MRLPRFVVVLVTMLAVLVAATPTPAAPAITVAPTITYGEVGTIAITGLTPGTSYRLTFYNPFFVPIVSFIFPAGADGAFTTRTMPPPQTPPGQYTFFVSTLDNVLVAKTTGMVTGTSLYFVPHRLGD